MKHPTGMEIEIKVRIPGTAELRPRLEAAGFCETVPHGPEESVLWDRDGELAARGSALRTRRHGGTALLTWKGPRQPHPTLKIRPERETPVADPEALAAILGELGFAPVMRMAKERSLWRRDGLEAALDQAPFGAYLELEGDPAAIEAALADLGLAGAEAEPRGYVELFRQWEAR